MARSFGLTPTKSTRSSRLTSTRGATFSSKHGDQSVQRLAPQFGGAKHEYVDAVAVDGLGDVVVIVQMDEEDSDAENSARARKVSGVDGALMWETALGDGSAEARSAPAVDLMPNGDAVVAWWLKRALPSQAHVTRLSGVDGGVVWTVPIDVGTSEIRVVTSLAVDAVGDIALIVGSASNAALLKLSGESGSQLRSSDASAGAVSFDPTGNVIVASSHVSRFSGAEGTFLGAVSSAFGEPTNMALAVSATGDIVLAGSTWANVTATDRYLDLDGFVMKVLQ